MTPVIIGGGIAGLSAALCLHQRGFSPTIVEQAAEFGEVGAGLQLGPNAVKVLRALGLETVVRRHSHMPEALVLRSGYSRHQMLSLPLGRACEQRWGAPYLHIHRAGLIDILAAAVRERGITCRFNAQVAAIRQGDVGVQLALSDGSVLAADLVIGADGVRSHTRACVFEAADGEMLGRPQFTGYVAWRATVPTEILGRRAPENAATVWTGRGRHAVTYLLRGGALCNFVGVVEQDVQADESWVKEAPAEAALADFKGFDPAILKILRKADVLHRWGIYERVPLAHWGRHHVVLIGDACHAMPPFLAQGAAMAIEDAWALAVALERSTDTAAAFSTFQSVRAPRVQKVADASRDNGVRFHTRPGLQRIGVFGALRAANVAVKAPLLKQLDWLYGYDVTSL